MKHLEMEIEEAEAQSFLRNGQSNGIKTGPPPTGTHPLGPFMKIGAISVILLIMVHFLTGNGGNDTDSPIMEPTGPSGPTSSNNQKAPAPSPTNKEQKPGFIYSKMATIVPDPFHVPIDQETKAKVAEQWGKWKFWDGDEDIRPVGDYCAEYTNRDIPGEDFPDDAWQADAVYVNHLLNDAENLISRTIEAIFTEYGHGRPLSPEQLGERVKLFGWDRVDLTEADVQPPPKFQKKGDRGNGGWTTDRSFGGLVRRLLHAMMTNDEFVVVMGGHSAAAGHGNHFHQSYMMQFHKIMAPVFARLGVKLVTRNMAQGGLGTLQASLASGSIYGENIDLLLWDSGMTEPGAIHHDIFHRQGLLSGQKVPVIWGGEFHVLRDLHNYADVDVGDFGYGTDAVIPVTSVEQAKSVPYASRYMKCSHDADYLCQAEPRFCATCWIPRSDLDPEKLFDSIDGKVGSQVKWHPGWRSHQLVGRTLAYAVLDALQVAMQTWSDGVMGGPPLEDDFWHVTKYYENIRTKLRNMPESAGECSKIADSLPERICRVPLKGATQHTPRANPEKTSIVSLLKAAPDGYIPQNKEKMMYKGPDLHNQCFDVPAGEIDVLAVASGRRLVSSDSLDSAEFSPLITIPRADVHDDAFNVSRQLANTAIVPGKGWEVSGEPPGRCDGEYNSICGRQRSSACPLIGHHDGRGFLVGNEYSGWLVMNLPKLKEGIIIIKLFTWLDPSNSKITQGWTSVNNERRRLGTRNKTSGELCNTTSSFTTLKNRRLKGNPPVIPDTFEFDFAINGKVTTWNKEQFLEKKKTLQRVFEAWTLLNDPNFVSQATDVELAIRMRGCGRDIAFGLTHIYWA